MDELHSILANHLGKTKPKRYKIKESDNHAVPTTSEIPDLFFDEVLVEYKLNRTEIKVLMYLYRKVWCRPNLYKKYGIGPILSYTDMGQQLKISMDEIYQALRSLESFRFIETIRSGQYFVRKYFSEKNDLLYNVIYDDF